MINWKTVFGQIVDHVRRAVFPKPKRKTKLADLTTAQKKERHQQQINESVKRRRAAEKAAKEQAAQAERDRLAKIYVLDEKGQPKRYANGAPVRREPELAPVAKPAPVVIPPVVIPQPQPEPTPMVMPFGLENVPADTDYVFLCANQSGAGEVHVYGFPVIAFDRWDDRYRELPQLQAVKHWFVIFNREKYADKLTHLRQFIRSLVTSKWARANVRYDAQAVARVVGSDEIQSSLKPIYTRLHPHDGSKPLVKSLIALYRPVIALPTDPVEIEKLISLPPSPRVEPPDFMWGGTGSMPPSDWKPPSGSGGNGNDGSGVCM